MGSPAIFSGSLVKLLKNNLKLGVNSTIFSGSVDPSATATTGEIGDLYVSNHATAYGLYVKRDSGSSVNWTKGSLIVQDEGIDISSAGKLNFVGPGVSVSSDGTTYTITIPGGGGGGSGGVGSDYLLSDLIDAELSTDVEFESDNQFKEDFEETTKGTFTNMAASGSALRFTGSNLTGSVERNKAASTEKRSVTGKVIMNLQNIAPRDEAILTPTSATRTIYFDGDVTQFFVVNDYCVIARRYLDTDTNSDGRTGYVFSFGSSSTLLKFQVASSSYNAGLDKTTITVTNADLTDITFGLASSDYYQKLRVIPYNYLVYGNSANSAPTGGQYEQMEEVDASVLTQISILGDSFIEILFSITGSVTHVHAKTSDSGSYGIMRIIEGGATQTAHIAYSVDGGKNWTKHATTKSVNANFGSENNSGDTFSESNLFIADNGMAVVTYPYYDAPDINLKAIYIDVSVGSPSISDTPTTGSGAGYVEKLSGTNSARSAVVAGNKSDASFIQVVCGETQTGTIRSRAYTSGGSVYSSASNITSITTTNNQLPKSVEVTKPDANHRTWLCYSDSSGNLVANRYTEGSATATSVSITATSRVIFGSTINPTRWIISHFDTSTLAVGISYCDLSGVAFSAVLPVVDASAENFSAFMGNSSSSANHGPFRTFPKTVISNPLNDAHAIVVASLTGSDSVDVSSLMEVPDMTSFSGVHTSQYTATSNVLTLRSAASSTQIAQTFTAGTGGYKSFKTKVYQTGSIASGSSMYAEIYATAAGLPTGAALYTSDTIDPSTISKNTSGQTVSFSFDGVSLTNAVVYAVVIVADYAISGSNHIVVKGVSGGSYAGGTTATYNGAVWAAGTDDIYFEWCGFWFKSIGNARQIDVSKKGIKENNSETQIIKYDNANAMIIFRKELFRSASDSDRVNTGHGYKKMVAWSGVSTVSSVLSNTINAAYSADSFDDNIVLNVSMGNPVCARINVTTGAVSATEVFEDRSGLEVIKSGGTLPSIVADASFDSGVCASFDGSTNYVEYTDTTSFDFDSTKPFLVEFEIKPGAVTGSKRIVESYNASSQGGMLIAMGASTSGDIAVEMRSSGAGTIAQTITATGFVSIGTYNVIRVYYDGLGGQIRISKSTSSGGVFTEATYNGVPISFSGNTSGITTPFRIGAAATSSLFVNAKIGYFKVIKGTVTPVYTGFSTQAPFVACEGIRNGLIIGRRVAGENSATYSNNFNSTAKSSTNISLVDSYPCVFTYDLTFVSSGFYQNFKIDAERPTTLDVGNIEGYNVVYNR